MGEDKFKQDMELRGEGIFVGIQRGRKRPTSQTNEILIWN